MLANHPPTHPGPGLFWRNDSGCVLWRFQMLASSVATASRTEPTLTENFQCILKCRRQHTKKRRFHWRRKDREPWTSAPHPFVHGPKQQMCQPQAREGLMDHPLTQDFRKAHPPIAPPPPAPT